MSRAFHDVAPGRIGLREGGGCMAAFGIPFLCAGIFVTLAAAGVVPSEKAAGTSAAIWPLLALFGTPVQLDTICRWLDVDYSTAESLLSSARRDAEQSVTQPGAAQLAGPGIGPRTERILTVLSRFARGRGVTLKTKEGLTSFGQGLSDEEIAYLYSVVKRALI